MAKLDKGTLALTFKFDCDRFLRFRLASEEERRSNGIEEETYKRPGIELITAAGRRWEADKYQDLVDTAPQGTIAHAIRDEVDELVGRPTFGKVMDLFDILRQSSPPLAVIEAEFDVPSDLTPALQEAYETYGLEPVRVRPDILWIRRAGTGAPLIGHQTQEPEYELHVIDVKMAAEPTLKHFTEVTYYALALAAALQQEGLTQRYAVSAEGLVWPGNHDVNAFRNLVRGSESQGSPDPLSEALLQTLAPVPYEVYQIHVRKFFEERLLRVLALAPQDADWHVGPKCQLCDYVGYCKQQAEECNHLCRVPWLNHGGATVLRSCGIDSVSQLREAIQTDSQAWQATVTASYQLRAKALPLLARSQALDTTQLTIVDGRRCAFMPAWADQNIFITVHFDPGTGITFALGAARVLFPHGRRRGDPPVTEQQVFIVDRVNAMNPETERARLVEFVTLISGWLQDVSDRNAQLPSRDRMSSHVFLWDMLEVRQLRRMFERHMTHPDVVDLIELLVRLFPPESILPDPDYFRSQPGTVVKEVIRLLVGLPIPHDYSLLDTANNFFPNTLDDDRTYEYQLPFGFVTPMSDQIPFERAYELWQDRIFLRHFDPDHPADPSRWRTYTRDELYAGIRHAIGIRLQALQHIVRKLRENLRDHLVLRKSGFSAAPPTQTRIPERARSLVAFQKLNEACRELTTRQRRLVPVEEREAHFSSIRGLRPATGDSYCQCLDEIRFTQQQYADASLMVFAFAPTSRDSRIDEGAFLLALSNEDSSVDLDLPWRRYLELSFSDAQELLSSRGLTDRWMVNLSLGRVLQVTVVQLGAMQEPPFLVLTPANSGLFQFAQDEGLVDFGRPMVLDPLYHDFATRRIEAALRTVGGNPPPMRRRRRRG